MAKKPEPSQPVRSDIYKAASKSVWLGIVEAPDKQAADEKAAVEFGTGAWRLIAVRRWALLRTDSAESTHSRATVIFST